MTPKDLEQAAADADVDLAELEGVDPDEFVALLHDEIDEYADLDCDHGAALAVELAKLSHLSEAERQALMEADHG